MNNLVEVEKYSEEDFRKLDVNDPMNVLSYIRTCICAAKAHKFIDEIACGILVDRIAKVETYIDEERNDLMIELFGYIPEAETTEEPKKEI
jgi:hypothetical protein